MRVNVTFDAAADARDSFGDGRRCPVLLGSDLERDDAAIHSFLRTIQKSACVSAISKPAFWYIDSGPTYCDQTHREGSTSPALGYASAVFIPRDRRCPSAASSSCVAMPWRRWSGATTKHTIAPTSLAASPGTLLSSDFGAAWHQPTTRPRRYATRPFAFAERRSSLREARFCSLVRDG